VIDEADSTGPINLPENDEDEDEEAEAEAPKPVRKPRVPRNKPTPAPVEEVESIEEL